MSVVRVISLERCGEWVTVLRDVSEKVGVGLIRLGEVRASAMHLKS